MTKIKGNLETGQTEYEESDTDGTRKKNGREVEKETSEDTGCKGERSKEGDGEGEAKLPTTND